MASIVHRLLELYPDALPRSHYPRVNDWFERLMARPAAIATYAAGTEETPQIAAVAVGGRRRRASCRSVAAVT